MVWFLVLCYLAPSWLVSGSATVYCIQLFHIPSVSCFRGIFRDSWGHGLSTRGRGAASQGPTDGVHGMPRVLRIGRDRPHPGSRVPPARREMRGSGERSGGRGAGRDRRGRTAAIRWECGTFLLDRSVASYEILSQWTYGRQQFPCNIGWFIASKIGLEPWRPVPKPSGLVHSHL